VDVGSGKMAEDAGEGQKAEIKFLSFFTAKRQHFYTVRGQMKAHIQFE
jgi:hypothetical protein